MIDNRQILERAIKKAVANGWTIADLEKGSVDDKQRYVVKFTNPLQIRGLLFDHDFARALWGDEPEYTLETRNQYGELTVDSDSFTLTNWKYQLQQMVIADDPIKYLGENL